MPLNNLPVTTTVAAFDLKLETAKRSSLVDFGFGGGLVPGNLGELAGLVERGVVGFKAFMCPSGIEEFPFCDAETLRQGMERIAELDSILLVHAEAPAELLAATGPTARDFIASRPWEAELSAIHQAIMLSRETGCRLHIVHVSTVPGIASIQDAQLRGIDVSGETCPHYLLYADEDLERLGRPALYGAPVLGPGHLLHAPALRLLTAGRRAGGEHIPDTLPLYAGAHTHH